MSLSVIRPYTDADKARVKATAERFCYRHGIAFGDQGETAETAIDYAIYSAHPEDKAYLRKLWTGCFCRALGVSYDVRTSTDGSYIGLIVP